MRGCAPGCVRGDAGRLGAAPSGLSAAVDGAQPAGSGPTPGQPRNSGQHLPAAVVPPGRRSVGLLMKMPGGMREAARSGRLLLGSCVMPRVVRNNSGVKLGFLC